MTTERKQAVDYLRNLILWVTECRVNPTDSQLIEASKIAHACATVVNKRDELAKTPEKLSVAQVLFLFGGGTSLQGEKVYQSMSLLLGLKGE